MKSVYGEKNKVFLKQCYPFQPQSFPPTSFIVCVTEPFKEAFLTLNESCVNHVAAIYTETT